MSVVDITSRVFTHVNTRLDRDEGSVDIASFKNQAVTHATQIADRFTTSIESSATGGPSLESVVLETHNSVAWTEQNRSQRLQDLQARILSGTYNLPSSGTVAHALILKMLRDSDLPAPS